MQLLMHPEVSFKCSPMLALHIAIINNNKVITNVTLPIFKYSLLFSIDFRMPFYTQAVYIYFFFHLYIFFYFFFLIFFLVFFLAYFPITSELCTDTQFKFCLQLHVFLFLFINNTWGNLFSFWIFLFNNLYLFSFYWNLSFIGTNKNNKKHNLIREKRVRRAECTVILLYIFGFLFCLFFVYMLVFVARARALSLSHTHTLLLFFGVVVRTVRRDIVHWMSKDGKHLLL